MVNFYRRHLPNAAKTLSPLQNLVTSTQPSRSSKCEFFTWSDDCKNSFKDIKEQLLNAIVLGYPSSNSHLTIHCDALDTAIGAVLHEQRNNGPIAIDFYSKCLTEAETKYSTYDKELLAAFLATKQFRKYIESHHTTLFTDHKPIIHSFNKPPKDNSPKQCRQLSFLAEYIDDVIHVKGSANVVADALSRAPPEECNALSTSAIDTLDLPGIARAQINDIQSMITNTSTHSLKLKQFKINDDLLTCDVSQVIPRPLIPTILHQQLFEQHHNTAHFGINATQHLLTDRYVWPNMKRDIKQWCQECLMCQQYKVNRHNKPQIHPSVSPTSRFNNVHMDIVGPLPIIDGYAYIVTLIDKFIRWPEALPVKSITADIIANTLIDQWISRFGVPLCLTTDRGRQFESEIFTIISKRLGIHRLRTTSYHPQSNWVCGAIAPNHQNFH